MKRLVVVISLAVVASACGAAASAAKPTPTPVKPVLAAATDGTLVDAKGFTLYFFVPEQGTKIVCTGDCVTMWKPLMAPGSAPPASRMPLPGVLATVDRPDGGRQVTYDGWPLYTFTQDKTPGDAEGKGAAGEWFVAEAAGESTPTPTPPPTPPPTPVPTAPPPPPPTMRPIPPPFNDRDADNRGGANDFDGNG